MSDSLCGVALGLAQEGHQERLWGTGQGERINSCSSCLSWHHLKGTQVPPLLSQLCILLELSRNAQCFQREAISRNCHLWLKLLEEARLSGGDLTTLRCLLLRMSPFSSGVLKQPYIPDQIGPQKGCSSEPLRLRVIPSAGLL